MGLRQRAKEKRRRRILVAARALIVDEGVEGLNMRRLADDAEISVATLYNHFGSKEELLQALLDQSFTTLNSVSDDVDAPDAIARAHMVVKAACAQFTGDAVFYRQLLRGLQSVEQGMRPSRAILRIWALADNAVQAAISEKAIEPEINARLLAQHILSIYSNTLRLWTIGRLDDETFTAQCLMGLDLVLLSFATAKTRARLIEHMKNLEPKILAGNPMMAIPSPDTMAEQGEQENSAA